MGWPTLQAHHVGRRHLGCDLDMAGVEQGQDLAVDRQRSRPGWRCARRPRRRTAPAPRHRPGSCLATSSCGSPTTATMEARFSAVARAWSAADCETMLRLASVSLSERSRAVQRASARAASSADWRSLTWTAARWSRSAPAPGPGDPVALAHQDLGQAAGDRALTMVWSIGWVGAGEAHRVDQAARLDGVQFGGDRARAAARRSPLAGRRCRTASLAALPGERRRRPATTAPAMLRSGSCAWRVMAEAP